MTTTTDRLLSLDVFRGLTVAGMILVNDPGSWNTVFSPLLHAEWHGCTPTDLVFPFFLFIVGVSITFSFGKQLAKGKSRGEVFRKASIRALILFGIGLFLAAFPFFGGREELTGTRSIVFFILLAWLILATLIKEIVSQEKSLRTYSPQTQRLWVYILLGSLLAFVVVGFPYFDFSHLRIPGVLQRIALGFFFTGMIYLYLPGWRNQLILLGIILVAYWILMTLVPVPDGNAPNLDAETNLGAWLDRTILGTEHLWSQAKTWDPEGILSTLPAIGNGILGLMTGYILQSKREAGEKTAWIFVAGSACIFFGLFWDLSFPINKKIWTSSYVLYTSGLGMTVLAMCYWLIDVKGYKAWTPFFLAFGTNAITAYVASSLLAKTLIYAKTSSGDSWWSAIYDTAFASWMNPYVASLMFAICFVLVCWLLVLYLYRNRIYVKV